MKCDCCDKLLSDYEATLKHAETEEYLNTCTKCLTGLGIPTKGRYDLSRKVYDDLDGDEFNEEIDQYVDVSLLIDDVDEAEYE